jgi:hypothetical protein
LDPDIPDVIYLFENMNLRKNNIDEIIDDKNEIINFIHSLNIIDDFIKLSNEMFDNLFNSDLFALTDIETSSWKELFTSLARDMSGSIEKIRNKYKEISESESDQSTLIKEMIDICEFNNYSHDFFDNILFEFNIHLNYNIAEKCPMIDVALDKLYYVNNIPIPDANRDDLYLDSTSLQLQFFNENSRGFVNNKTNFPIYESSDTRIHNKIKFCITDKINRLTKNKKRIYFTKKLIEGNFKNKFSRQISVIERFNISIVAESIIAVIDTSMINNLSWGIWFCYDGIYLRKVMHTDYIPYQSVIEHILKKPSDIFSAIIFKKDTGAEIEYEERSVNKEILIQIFDEIKEIINNN